MKPTEFNQIELRRETLFKDAVLSEAEAKSMEIVAEANKTRTRELEQAQLACGTANHDVIQRRLARDNDREYSGLAQQARRDLLAFRAKLVDRVFSEVEARLVAFREGPEYDGWLTARLLECSFVPGAQVLVCHTDDPSKSVVQLRRADSAHEDTIKKALPGCTVEYTDDILLGGLRVQRGSFLFDKTLDSALETEKQRFYENSGLTV